MSNLFEENDKIICNEYDGLKYLQFKKLLDFNIKHCYTLRSDNFDFSKNANNLKQSLQKLSEIIDVDFNNIVIPVQSHTDMVKCINKVILNDELENVDGLITDRKNIAISTKNADCILLLFYDPIKKVIANVHSGWKGTFKKIAEKTVVKMMTLYKCNPEDINCFICPSIRKCHFEVDEDVKILCENIFNFLDTNLFIEKGNAVEGKQKYYIDTVLINKLLLMNLGLKEENIIDSNICSVCNNDKLYSYRAEKENAKRNLAIICL